MSDRHPAALDVSRLPTFGFSHRSLMWWGTAGMMLIEATVFALTIMAYFYLRSRTDVWPPTAHPLPDWRWGTLNTAILLASALPNHYAKSAAERLDLPRVRLWLLVGLLFAFGFLAVRVLEFGALHVSWDSNAYGSVIWTLMGLHTAHMVTDVIDTIVLAVLMHTRLVEGKRFVDVSENALYWYFVVYAWLPIYAVVYLVPRL